VHLLEDADSPLSKKLGELYGDGEDLTAEPARVCLGALEEFGRSYGPEREVVIARATGRINLLGMHVDHRGGSVNPIAIKEVFFVAEGREDDLVALQNVDSGEFPEESFRIGGCIPVHKIADWDAWCHDEFEKRKGDPSVTWSSYVRAAVLRIQHLNTGEDGALDPPLRGMNVVVHGNIPRAAGLSSSSSMVVAAAEACLRVNNLSMGPEDLVEMCGYAEWYVGTRGGAGDHAAIKFGKPGHILHLTSFPLTAQAAPLPPGYRVVLANSMVEAKKRAGARDEFNNRVASYVFGLMLARQNFTAYRPKLEHIRDINPQTLGVDETEIYHILKSLPETATRDEVLSLLPDEGNEVAQVFRSHVEPREGYKIRQVCLYGVGECLRSEMAFDLFKDGNVEAFGQLMSISHDGDRVTRNVDGKRVPIDKSYPDRKIDALVRDLLSEDPELVEGARLWRQPGGYNVSVQEMDAMVDIAIQTPGVVGAGLGGSIAALVREGNASELLDNLKKGYYLPRGLPTNAEIVRPVGGSGILDI
jgi:N-acetylgalactosamine kinase